MPPPGDPPSRDPIDDGILRLRPFTPSDASPTLQAIRESLPDISRWLPSLHDRLTEHDLRTWIESTEKSWTDSTSYHFAILDAQSNHFLGGINLFQLHWGHRLAQLSYWTRATAQGKNIATNAVRLLARDFAFDLLHLNRIEIIMAITHPASRRVAEKSGAKFEGTLRNRIGFHNQTVDAHLYSLIPADLQSHQE